MLSLLCSSPRSSDTFDDYPKASRPLKARRLSFQLGSKKRRVVKGSISSPADFRHSGHVGPSNIHLLQSQPEIWDVESWKLEVQTRMQQVMNPVEEEEWGPRIEATKLHDGPKARAGKVEKLKRPSTAPGRTTSTMAASATAEVSVAALSQPPSPTKAQHRASTSFPTPPRRKPPPEVTASVLNAVANAQLTTSPAAPMTYTLVPDMPSSTSSSPGAFSVLSSNADTTITTPDTTPDVSPAPVEKPLVPLLDGNNPSSADIPKVYVTQTTKARWDGAMEEIALALKDDST